MQFIERLCAISSHGNNFYICITRCLKCRACTHRAIIYVRNDKVIRLYHRRNCIVCSLSITLGIMMTYNCNLASICISLINNFVESDKT